MTPDNDRSRPGGGGFEDRSGDNTRVPQAHPRHQDAPVVNIVAYSITRLRDRETGALLEDITVVCPFGCRRGHGRPALHYHRAAAGEPIGSRLAHCSHLGGAGGTYVIWRPSEVGTASDRARRKAGA